MAPLNEFDGLLEIFRIDVRNGTAVEQIIFGHDAQANTLEEQRPLVAGDRIEVVRNPTLRCPRN